MNRRWVLAACLAGGVSVSVARANTVTYQNGLTDPFTHTTYTGVQDTTLTSNAANGNWGVRSDVQIGPSANFMDHGLMRFDLSSLAGNYGTINSVTLVVHFDDIGEPANGSYNATMQVYQLAAANAGWVEGTSSSTTAVTDGSSTWAYRNQTSATTGTNWAGSAGAATAGTDYLTTLLTSYNYDNTIATHSGAGAVSLSLPTSIVGDWLSGTNSGLFFKSSNEGPVLPDDERIGIQSSNSSQALRPELIIDYTPVPEPASLGVLGVAAAGLVLRRRR